MRAHSLCGGFFLFLFSLTFVVSFCNGDDKTIFEVAGIWECADCKENKLGASQAFSGLHVTVDCKLKTGEMKRVGAGELDNQGKFKVPLPQQIVQQDGRNLKHECYAQLHSAAALPCPAHNGLEASKIVFKSLNKEKIIFGPTNTFPFSASLCTSKFFLHCPPFFKHKLIPPLAPPMVKPLPPPAPTYKPNPKPKPPMLKSFPPPAPVYKPKPKPKPAPKPKVPVVKPLPPPVPISKPKTPVPPVVTKPMPPPIPLFPFPPFYKKHCPPLPKLPPFPKIHPKFGHFPPLPPHIPHT
ncbi:hypothetical protein BUALT_Bualt19G0123500 [Buddleja alternifolia]|uniref:Proline-rich protein n=1 Tax=Buddleja alternifolia TaxID=168488 RepID=A0AAV6W2X6_9LAMI|nr:hypothetical protein BUALT_Bualt19G0123500 [Buddleja alternifolia]